MMFSIAVKEKCLGKDMGHHFFYYLITAYVYAIVMYVICQEFGDFNHSEMRLTL